MKLGLLVGGILMALLASEGMVRLMGYTPLYYYPQYLFVADDTVEYQLASHFTRLGITTSSWGFRGTDTPCDILGLGDSYTFGTGVKDEETYLARLGALRGNVCNAAVPGYGTKHELAFLTAYGALLMPDLVILGVSLNDVTDNMAPPVIIENGFRVSARGTSTLPLSYHFKAWMRRHSALYGLLIPYLKTITILQPYVGQMLPSGVQYFRSLIPPDLQRAWEQMVLLVGEIHETTNRMETQLLVVLIPTREQVYLKQWEAMVRRFGLTETTDPTALLREQLTVQEIDVLDLLPWFQDLAKSGNQLYLPHDAHLSPDGHQAIATAIQLRLGEETRREE